MLAVSLMVAGSAVAAAKAPDRQPESSSAPRLSVSPGQSKSTVLPVALPANYSSLTAEQRRLIPTRVTIETGVKSSAPSAVLIKRQPSAVAMASGCNTGWGRETYSNSFMKLYYWQVNDYYCFNGSKVTSVSSPWVNAYVYGGAAASWSYEGEVSETSYGSGTTQGVAYAEGHFKYAPPPKLWTLFNGWPWVRLYLHPNGTLTMSGSAS